MKTKSDVMISMSDFSRAFESGVLKLDLHGHYHNLSGEEAAKKLGINTDFLYPLHRRDVGKPGSPTLMEAKQLKAWLADPVGNPQVRNVRVDNLIGMLGLRNCSVCGHNIDCGGAVIDRGVVRLLDKCPYPNGIPDLVLRLYCPSGKFVVANDLREVFPTVEPEESVNYHTGLDLTSKAYEQAGMIHCFVGNTCPSMYRLNNETFAIGARPPVRGARSVAGITTDLWWYSIVDHDEYLDRLNPEWRSLTKQEVSALLRQHEISIVKCRPGVYQFRHQFPRLRNQEAEYGHEPYTVIKWVANKPKRLPRYRERYLQYNYTTGQVVWHFMESWPTLFKEVRRLSMTRGMDDLPATLQESVALVADHLFFTNGSGSCNSYHPNGWTGGCFEMGDNPPDLEIPTLTKPVPYCYPLSEWSLIAEVVGMGQTYYRRQDNMERHRRPDGSLYLNPSFLRLAFNYLHAVLRYGVRPVYVVKDELVKDEEKRWDSTIEHAQKYFVKLVEQNPDQVPDYAVRLFDRIRRGTYKPPALRIRRPTKWELELNTLRQKAADAMRAKLSESKEPQ